MAASETQGSWRPILSTADAGADGALAAQAEAALDDIAAALAEAADEAAADERARGSLSDGPAGIALFHHYLDQARPGQGHDERALASLELAIEATADAMTSPGLFGGFTGVAWTLEHLTGRLLEAPTGDEDDPGEEVATAINDYLRHTPWNDDYDLISGLVGFGVWGIERGPRAGGAAALRSVVERLDELAERGDDGITWRTPPHRMLRAEAERDPDGNYNLGVAHGVPGVIGLLAEMSAAGVAPAAAAELLTGSVSWLWHQTLADPSSAVFPYSRSPTRRESLGARLAWCYGDAGIAPCLLHAARVTGNADTERQALELARKAAERPDDQAGVQDGGLCHGAGGLVHLFNRLYQATGEELFRRQAIHWIERLFELRKPGQGYAGWSSWRPLGDVMADDPQLGWLADSGFLTGTAGIGLALLGASSPVEPEWDRVLLSSVRPRGLQARLPA